MNAWLYVQIEARFFQYLSFRIMSAACDPLAVLQRWVSYKQLEVLQIKRELHEHRQEILATQEIQQQQLDSLQPQIQEDGQRTTELIDAVTELFRKQGQTQDLLVKLLADFSSLQAQSKPPEVSAQDIPATQPYNG